MCNRVSGIVSIRCAAADEKTDVAATILRMLYIKDLRGLQTLIDETLVNVQVSCAFTSLQACMLCSNVNVILCFLVELYSQPKN